MKLSILPPIMLSVLLVKQHIYAKDRSRMTTLLFMLLLASLLPLPARAQSPEEEVVVAETTVVEQIETPDGIDAKVRIGVQKDAFLSSNNPNTNYGGDQTLRLGWGTNSYNAMRILIQFDMKDIPRNAVIHSARLYIYQSEVIPGNENANMGYRPQFMRESWNEHDVTWNNANYLGGDILPVSDVDSSLGWKSVDVTNLVKTWYSGARTNHGLIVTGDETPAAGRERHFNAREKGDSAPYIEIDYTQACDSIAPNVSINALPQFSPGAFPVTWNGTDSAPSNCNPSGVATYDVEYRINGSDWHRWKNQTESTTNHFKDWAENSDFVEIRARATDLAGNVGQFGNPQASTRIDTLPPQVVVNALPNITTSPAFVVSWSGSDNLSGVAHYDVQWRENSGSWQILLEEAAQTSYQVTGAQSGVTYDFRVRATDNAGNGDEWPDQPQVTTQISANAIATISPFVPSILKPTDPVTTSFIVHWSLSAAAAPGTSYEVYYQYKGGSWRLWQNFPNSQTSAQFPLQTLGMGDGYYGFEAIVIDGNGQPEERRSIAEAGMLVDLADAVQPRGYLPIITSEFNAVAAEEGYE